jgi:hypothetical protein
MAQANDTDSDNAVLEFPQSGAFYRQAKLPGVAPPRYWAATTTANGSTGSASWSSAKTS